MEITYKRDLKHNYMIIALEGNYPIDYYSSKIMEYQNIDGILSIEQRRMDNKLLLYYDITTKQSMQTVLEKATLSYNNLNRILTRLLTIIEITYDYLLSEDDFILAPEHIYLDITSFTPSLCYLNGYHKNIKEQMSTFLEYLLNKVDYNDKEAVFIVYQLYAVSREEDYSFDHLIRLMNRKDVDMQSDHMKQYECTNMNHISNDMGRVISNQHDVMDNTFRIKAKSMGVNLNERNQEINNNYYKEKRNTESSKSYLEKNVNIHNHMNPDNKIGLDKINYAKKLNSKNSELEKNKLSNIKSSTACFDNRQNGISNKQGIKSLHIPNLQDIRNKRLLHKAEKERTVGKSLNNLQKETTSEKLYLKYNKIPVMLEKLEDEEERVYYPLKTYLYTSLCFCLGVTLIYIGITSKIIFNTFGNRIDYSKLFALCLLMLCFEGYAMKIIWNSKNKITKMIQRKEYVDPRLEFSLFSKRSLMNQERKDRKDLEPVKQHHQKEYNSSGNIVKEKNESISGELKMTMKPKYVPWLSHNKSNEEEDQEVNPTCLLNEEEEIKSFTIILKPVDEINCKTIVITDFPFFIGKLKKNVDYCLENDVVSRFHAKISLENEKYFITDLNSKNGTFLNKELLQTYQKREIKVGDEIAFANIKYNVLRYD